MSMENRRPQISELRIQGLQSIATRVRPWLNNRAGRPDLIRLSRRDKQLMAAGVAYIDDMAKWYGATHPTSGVTSDGGQHTVDVNEVGNEMGTEAAHGA